MCCPAALKTSMPTPLQSIALACARPLTARLTLARARTRSLASLQARKSFVPGPFSLGRLSDLVSVAAIFWVLVRVSGGGGASCRWL